MKGQVEVYPVPCPVFTSFSGREWVCRMHDCNGTNHYYVPGELAAPDVVQGEVID